MGIAVYTLFGLCFMAGLMAAQETTAGKAESLQQTTPGSGSDNTESPPKVSQDAATEGDLVANGVQSTTPTTRVWSEPSNQTGQEAATVAMLDGNNATGSNVTSTDPPRPPFVWPTYSDDFYDAAEFYKDAEKCFNYFASVVPWVGLVTNSLSFFGWCLLGKADGVIRMILMALALFDILSLINMMDYAIFYWSDSTFSLQQNTDSGCKYIQWVANGARNVSAYLILCFTFDRFLSVWFPIKRRAIMTQKKVAIAIAVIIILGFASESYMPGLLYEVESFGQHRCLVRDGHKMSVYSSIFRNGIGFLLPMILVAILNGLVIHRLRKYKDYIAKDPTLSGRTKKAEAENQSLTITLIIVSIFSFLVYLPKTVVFYMRMEGAYNYQKTLARTYRFYGAVFIVDSICMLNYCFNFFFYCLGARRFRQLLARPFKGTRTFLRQLRGRHDGWNLDSSVTQTGQQTSQQTKYASESSVDSEIVEKEKPVEKLTKV